VLDVHPDDRDEYITTCNQAFLARQPFSLEYRLRRHDGEYRWVIDSGAPRWQEKTVFTGYIGTCIDISERKLSEKALHESEARYRSILTASPDIITITDLGGRILMVSPVALALCRCTREDELVGHLITDFIDSEFRERAFENIALMFQGVKKGPGEYRGLRADGSSIDVEVNGEFIRNDEGQPTSMVFIIRDITERKRTEIERLELEQQFHQAQKLESLGVLASGIAHDFNNILTIILGYCYLAKEDFSDEPSKLDHFKNIEMAARRAADLCQQMLTYAGKSQLAETRVNVWLLVDEVIRMLQSAIKKNVSFELDLIQRVPEIKGEASKIQQIVMNLIINAAEAIGSANGTIRVVLTKTAIESDTSETDTFGTRIMPGRYVCLEVSDTGIGMDAATQKRIFEPFYTTKSTGRGLGMSAIRNIVMSHEGILQLTSTPGTGTTFKVFFPVPEASDSSEAVSSVAVPTEMPGGTILLVEDEHKLLDLGKTLLETLGFIVITAQNGGEALEIYSQRRSEIDAILMDLIMPVMGGIDCYNELRKIAPLLPVIFCSGYNVEQVSGVIEKDPHASFVQKPFDPTKLLIEIVTMLRTAPGAAPDIPGTDNQSCGESL
jgi:PAS domain S-box-containing protein